MKTFLEQYKQLFPLIVMLSLFTGMGAIIWLGVIPYQGFIDEKAGTLKEFDASRENRERQIGKLPELQGQLETIAADEHTLDILLSEKNIVEFVKTLEQLAQETHTRVTIVAKDKDAIQEKKKAPVGKKEGIIIPEESDPQSAAKKSSPSLLDSVPYDRYLHVTIAVLGEYRNIFSFLHKMETLPVGLDVIGLSIGASSVEVVAKKPDAAPANNPFAMFADGLSVATPTLPVVPLEESGSGITGPLEASFDTVIYLRKQE